MPKFDGRMPFSVKVALGCFGFQLLAMTNALIIATYWNSSEGLWYLIPFCLLAVGLLGIVFGSEKCRLGAQAISVMGGIVTLIAWCTLAFFALLFNGMLDSWDYWSDGKWLDVLIAGPVTFLAPASFWISFFALGRPSAMAYFNRYQPIRENSDLID